MQPLLGQMRIGKTLWINSSKPFDPENLISHLGLTSIKFTVGRLPSLAPKGSLKECTAVTFSKWWTQPVIVSVSGVRKQFYSRQNIVLNVAETDGGAHVDEGLEEIYHELSRQNGLGISAIYKGKKYPMLYPELPCLRQIGHEALISLKRANTQLFEHEVYLDEFEFEPHGMVIENMDPSEKIGFEFHVRDHGDKISNG